MAGFQSNKGKDLYAVLGVPRTADASQIKKAYRKLAKKYHPDMNAGNEEKEKKFKDISEANAILGDPEKKKIYDTWGYAAFESGMDPKEYAKRMEEAEKAGFRGGRGFGDFGSGFGGFGTGAGSGGFYRTNDGGYSYHYEGGSDGSAGDFFERLFRHTGRQGAAGGRFSGGYYGTGNGSTWDAEEKLDREIQVRLSFEESVLGCDRNVRIQKQDGSGTQTLCVHIPAGIEEGKSIRLRGKGAVSADGRRKGDILLKVSVSPGKEYTRQGRDLYTSVFVPFATAALGGEAQVRLPGGKSILCRVPAGTDAGKKIRIRGKGIVSEKGDLPAGDLYVTVQVQVPGYLTEAEKQKLREFSEMVDARTKGRTGSRPAGAAG